MCQEEVKKLIFHVDRRSLAGAVVEGLIERSWTEFGRKKVWDMLNGDEDLKRWTKERLKLDDEDRQKKYRKTGYSERQCWNWSGKKEEQQLYRT